MVRFVHFKSLLRQKAKKFQMFSGMITDIWFASDIWRQTEELNRHPRLEQRHVNYRHHFLSARSWDWGFSHTEHSWWKLALQSQKRASKLKKEGEKKTLRENKLFVSHYLGLFRLLVPMAMASQTLGRVSITTYSKKNYGDAFSPANEWRKKFSSSSLSICPCSSISQSIDLDR